MDSVLSDNLLNALKTGFGIDEVRDVKTGKAGLLCLNYTFADSTKRFFLKQYRHSAEDKIVNIRRAEEYFAEYGVPAIVPIKHYTGDRYFNVDGNWHSLFPFIENQPLPATELTPEHTASFGVMLGRIHKYGLQANREIFLPFSFWQSDEDFFSDVKEVEKFVAEQETMGEYQLLALENLRRQKDFLLTNERKSPKDFLPLTGLIHGDFLYTNVFFEGFQLKYVYDFDNAGIAPRAFELLRSIFITCFDDGWEEKNFELARTLLKGYQTVFPISKSEFIQGAYMYRMHFMHLAWMEKKVILEKSSRHYELIRLANMRMHHFLESFDDVINAIFVT